MKIHKNKPSNIWKGKHKIFLSNKITLKKNNPNNNTKKMKIFRNKPCNKWKGKHTIYS